MRTLHTLVFLLGLAVIVLSSRQIQQVRQYTVLVSEVQKSANDLYQAALKLRPANMSIFMPSMGSVTAELDSAKRLERGWWLAGGVGCATCVCGLFGFIMNVCKRGAANKPLQATAASPCS